MSAIFVSYRRKAALLHARAVFERLCREFGPAQVFIDLEGIDVGVDFAELIERQLQGCRVLLALIEPEWANAVDSKGRRRLELPNDFVRVEIATALRRRIRVMPILIDGAEMPEEAALPEDLRHLTRLNAQMLDFNRFDTEIGRLVAAIQRVLETPVTQPGERPPAAEAGAPAKILSQVPPAVSPSVISDATAKATSQKPSEVRPATPPIGSAPTPAPKAPASPPAGPVAAQGGLAEPEQTGALGGRRRLLAAAAGMIAIVAVAVLTTQGDRQATETAPVSQAPVPAAAPSDLPAVAPATLESTASGSPGAQTAGIAAWRVFRDCPECPEMVVIPAGSFLMGSPDTEPERRSDEGPQRRVNIGRFAIGRTEVTQGQWYALMGGKPTRPFMCGDDCPMVNVSWSDAQAYVRKLSEKTGQTYTLPSEAQWEYAARAGTTTPFHTGPTITTDQANFNGNYTYNGSAKGVRREEAVKVGSFAPNRFGLYDVHGNVWEWVQDCYDEQAYRGKAPSDGRAHEVAACASRVLRGGAWFDVPWYARAANRYDYGPNGRPHYFGFRVCRVSLIE